MSSMPVRQYEPAAATGGAATIGKAVMIKGQIFSREDLYIDGEIEGAVEVADHRLTVGPNGKLKAGVKAREIIVLGVITGNVEAIDKVDLRKDARLIGDIAAARIVIEDGAYVKGSIEMTGKEAPKARPQATQPAAASAAAAGPQAVDAQRK